MPQPRKIISGTSSAGGVKRRTLVIGSPLNVSTLKVNSNYNGEAVDMEDKITQEGMVKLGNTPRIPQNN
jgi:hypothetical protein